MNTKQTISDLASDSTTYVGSAELGVPTSVKEWSILKIVTNGTIATRFYPVSIRGTISDLEEFEWDERANLTYAASFKKEGVITLTTLTIASDNAIPSLAKVGDTITLTIVSSGDITTPIVTIGTQPATVVAGIDSSHWTATRVMTSSDVNGIIPFSVSYADLSTGYVAPSVVTKTGGSDVTFDKQVVTLSTVTIASNNTTPTLAKEGDTITLTFVATESLTSKPTVTIATHAIDAGSVTQGIDAKYWTATYVMVAGDATGNVPFTINGTDIAGNPLAEVSVTTNGISVTYDKTVPTILSALINTNTQITVTLSELAIASTITKANAGGFVVSETGTPATTYAVSAIAPDITNDKVILTVANMLVSAKEGITVTYASGGNGTVADLAGNLLATNAVGVTIAAWDLIPPTILTAERIANTTLRVTLSEIANTSSITKANAGGFVVKDTVTPATTYAVSAIAPNGGNYNQIDLTVATIIGSAATGVTVTYVSGGNGTVQDIAGNLMVTDATGKNVAAWA